MLQNYTFSGISRNKLLACYQIIFTIAYGKVSHSVINSSIIP